MNAITFTAGYGDPTRTIRQKYGDYGKIEQLMNKLRSENTQLEATLGDLETQRKSLIESFNNVTGLNREEIQGKINQLAEKISGIKYKIEENKSTIVNSWYGYHERV